MRIHKPNVLAAALAVAGSIAGGLVATAAARAQDCPGHPNALGTSRVITARYGEFTRLGTLQYPLTLPLADKEVVLTFDDGPLPPYTQRILDTLASQCVKATFFMVGEMAHAYPGMARKVFEAGHAIGTHSQDHAYHFQKLSPDRVRHEIDDGIASVGTALGDPADVAPFFRIPGLARTNVIESDLAARSIITFSVDVVADDWHPHITPDEIIKRAMRRLEKRGGGILLLHDIHPATAAALPGLLAALKEHGFHIVQVVPGTPREPAEPQIAGGLMLASAGSDQTVMDDASHEPVWPPFADAVSVTDDVALPVPDAAAFNISFADTGVGDFPDIVQWPEQPEAALPSAAPQLAAPSIQDIGMPLQASAVLSNNLGGPNVGLRRLETAASAEDARGRHVRSHPHHRARTAGPANQHATLFTGLLALLGPAR